MPSLGATVTVSEGHVVKLSDRHIKLADSHAMLDLEAMDWPPNFLDEP